MEEEDRIEEEELDIKDLADSSIEDENKSMFDMNEFNFPEIDFDSTEMELEDQIKEEEDNEEGEEISVRSESESQVDEVEIDSQATEQGLAIQEEEEQEEIPDMSPMEEMLVEDEEEPENNFSVDEVKIDFQATEQGLAIQEEAQDYGVTVAEKTEVAIIETVATDRLSDIRKEYEAFGLQPPVTDSVHRAETAKEGRGIQAASPMDFDVDKLPPMGAGVLPTSSAFFKVQGGPNIKIGDNPYGYG